MGIYLDYHRVLLSSKVLQDGKVLSLHPPHQTPSPSSHNDQVRLDNTSNQTKHPHLKTLVSSHYLHSPCLLVLEPQIHQPHHPRHLNLLQITLSSQVLQKVNPHFILAGKLMLVNDSRWKFKDEGMLPNPRPYKGIMKDYKSGRKEGSTVPIDLRQFT